MRRFAPAAVAWAGAATLVVLWLPTRGALELNPVALGAGIPFALRLDAIAFACALAVLVGGAGLLTLRPAGAWALLPALAAAVLAVVSADLLLTAAATGLALLFILQAIPEGDERPLWRLGVAVLLAGWAGVSLQVLGGTAGYGAAPASALNAGIAGLVLLAAVVLVGAFPLTGAWPGVAWIVLPPIGFCLLLRVYTLGDGQLPHPALNIGLALAGVLAWGLAGWRAAAAATWREFAAASLPGLGGAGLAAAGSGVQLGGVAVVFALFAMAVLAVLCMELTQRRRADALIAVAVIAGLPPGLGFVARLLAVQSVLESEQSLALLIVPAALAWLLWLFAGVRAVSLAPAGGAAPRWLAPVFGAASAGLGLAAGLLAAGIAQPAAAAAAMRGGPHVTAGLAGLEPASGGWPALVLGGLLVAAMVAAVAAAGTRLPVFAEALPPLVPSWRPRRPAFQLPRLRGAAAAEAALTGRRPLLWIVLIAVLAIVVTRAPL